MDPTDLTREAGAVLTLLSGLAAALAAAAFKFGRDAAAPSAPIGGGARPPRLSRAQLLSLLGNAARNAERAQAEALEAVTSCDDALPAGFSGLGGGRSPLGGGGRRRAAPAPDAVAAAFRLRLAELDEELLRVVGGSLGAASAGPLSDADVAHALRCHACAEVAAAEARVASFEPAAIARDPIALSKALRLPVVEGDSPAEAAASPATLLSLLGAITDAAPAHFQAAVGGMMQASGGQPGPGFVQQCAQAARGAALREVTAPGGGSLWAGRPSSFEFAVNLLCVAAPAFQAAWLAEVQKTMAQLSSVLQQE